MNLHCGAAFHHSMVPHMSDLIQSMAHIGHPRILVLGDLMLDRYTWGDAERISPEAPVAILLADQEEVRPGGAASVAYLLRHLEADVAVAGVVGNDSDGHTLRALLQDEGIDEQLVLVDSTRSTTAKHRFVGRASDRHPHQILRVDHESRTPLRETLADDLWDAIESRLAQFDAILIADYLKGVCTDRLLRQVIPAARERGLPILVDPGRISNYERYRGVTLLKPNRIEAELVTGQKIADLEQTTIAAQELCGSLDVDAIVITLDRDGLIAVTATSKTVIATDPREVYDITGAGDMVLAMLGLCVAGGIGVAAAARLANIAAGLEVERFGIASVTRNEITARLAMARKGVVSKLVSVDDMVLLAAEYRKKSKRIVFTNGCFDLLHLGHVTYLQEAAVLADVLVVAVNSDASVRRLKGSARPIIPVQDRATLLSALECIDHVLIFEEDTPRSLIEVIRPDVLVKGGTTSDVVGRDIVEAYGGKVRITAKIHDLSTTQLIASMRTNESAAD